MIEKKEKCRNNSQSCRKMDEDSQIDSKQEMVATLQARKEVLEAELSNKNKELKMLCIQEAELTGILPPETPLEPGESPPVFRRRVGTVFTYPENLLSNSKKSTEEDTLTALELECKIQRGIAEAALGLANEAVANKAVRRKHRLMYQQSQQRLTELETKLNTLRQAGGKRDQKQRKKPRPPLGCENDSAEREDLLLQGVGVSLSPLQDAEHSARAYWDPRNAGQSQMPYLKHSATYGGRSHHETKHSRSHLPLQRHASGGHIVYSPNNAAICQYYVQTNVENQDYNYWPQNTAAHGEKVWYATAPRQNTEHVHWEKDRFGSLDRRQYHSASVEARNADDAARQSYFHYHTRHGENKNHSPVVGVLLPNQTYPEHSLGVEGQIQGGHVPLKNSASVPHSKEYKPQVPVDYKVADTNREKRTIATHKDCMRRHDGRQNMYQEHGLEYNVLVNCHVSVDPEATMPRGVPRTQSLGSMESHDLLSRKQKEKQWYETSLDSSPAPVPPVRQEDCESKASPVPDASLPRSCSNSVSGSDHGSQSFEILSTEVPVESPQNHTVVQPGKWQPYREVTKPFEMSDFYKYSTKFRKLRAQQEAEAQQKGARAVPPQPAATCQVLPPDCGRGGDMFSAELLQWYQDRNIPCSATLV